MERKGDLPDALEQMKAAVAADPTNVSARSSLAGLYLRSGDKTKVEETLQKAADDLSDDKDAAGLLRSYYAQTNQLDRAETAYAALVAKHPKSTPLKVGYARVLLVRQEIPKGKEVIADLMKSDPNDPDVADLDGSVLLVDGKVNEAVDILQKAAKNYPENLPVKLLLGRAALMKGDIAVADESYRDAGKLNPRNLDAINGRAQVALAKQDYTLLNQIAESALALSNQLSGPGLRLARNRRTKP